MITFRRALAGEESEIMTLTSWVAQDETTLFFVAEENQTLIGAAAFSIMSLKTLKRETEGIKKKDGLNVGSPVGLITGLYVTPDMRRMHIGDGLFRAVLNYFNRQGIRTVLIDMRPDGIEAKACMEGFMAFEEILKSAESETYTVTLPAFFERPCRGGHV